MVFVTLNAELPALARQVEGLEAQMRAVLPGFDGLHHARRDVLDIPANWKLIFDGLECYHCPFIHPGVLNSEEDYMTRDIHSVEYGRFQHHVFKGNRAVIDGMGGRPRPAWAENLDSYDLNLWYLWPNIILMSHPGRANLKVAHAWPIAPGKSVRIIDHFLTTPEPTALDLAQIEQHAAVFRQDIAAMVASQTGMRARGYRQSRLMIDPEHSWQSEHSTHHFQKLVWDAVKGS
jgi:phenylpropionate dioxygenase-like ring-hydroxylating dioxygenase large terminal subunit